MARKSKEANRVYYRNYYKTHKKELRTNQLRYEEKHPRVHIPDSTRDYRLTYLYKITEEQYEEKLKTQGNHCALCSTKQGEDKRRMAVDHDHKCCVGQRSCGKCVRGILCANCNRRVGFLEELLAEAQVYTLIAHANTWLHRATVYLRKWREIHKLVPTERRDDGYEIHNRRCSFGLGNIGGPGCICKSDATVQR